MSSNSSLGPWLAGRPDGGALLLIHFAQVLVPTPSNDSPNFLSRRHRPLAAFTQPPTVRTACPQAFPLDAGLWAVAQRGFAGQSWPTLDSKCCRPGRLLVQPVWCSVLFLSNGHATSFHSSHREQN